MPTSRFEKESDSHFSKLFASNGFSWLFSAFMAVLIILFYLDDHGKVAVLNNQLAEFRRQRDREIVQTNGDITNLQKELLNAQKEIRNDQKALIQAQRRLAMSSKVAQPGGSEPVAMTFESMQENPPMSPSEAAKYSQLIVSLKAIDVAIENNLSGLLEGAKTLKAIRLAILDLHQKPWYRPTEGRIDEDSRKDGEDSLISEIPQLVQRISELKSPKRSWPSNIEAAMFEVDIENNELTQAQHELLRMQNDLLAAEKELKELESLAPQNSH